MARGVKPLSSIAEIWRFVVARRRKEIFFVVLLIFISAIAEVISIGAVIPFLGLISNPEESFNNEMITKIASYLSISDPKEFAVYITCFFCAAVLFAGILRICLLKAITYVSHLAGSDLSVYTYEKIINRSYEEQILTNSSDLIGGITTKINNTTSVIYSLISLIGGFFVFLILSAVIFFINYQVALASVLIFGTGYIVVARHTRRKLVSNSKVIAENTGSLVKILQESIGGIRDVILDKLQPYFIEKYKPVDCRLRAAMGDNLYRGGSPRFIMETVGILLISVIALYLSLSLDDPSEAVAHAWSYSACCTENASDHAATLLRLG